MVKKAKSDNDEADLEIPYRSHAKPATDKRDQQRLNLYQIFCSTLNNSGSEIKPHSQFT